MRLSQKVKAILHFQGSAIMLVVSRQTVSKIRKTDLLQRKRYNPEYIEGQTSKEDWR